jgi:pyruvate-formate lyase
MNFYTFISNKLEKHLFLRRVLRPLVRILRGIIWNVYRACTSIIRPALVIKRAKDFRKFLSKIDIEPDLNDDIVTFRPDYSFLEGFRHFGPNACVGNLTPGYFKVVRKGLLGIRDDINESLRKADTRKSKKHLQAMLIACEGAIEFSRLIARKAEQFADSKKDTDNGELYREKVRILKKVPLHPADIFIEAIQSLWVIQMIVWMEGNHYLGFGRLDQDLYPCYKRDLEEQKITPERAYSLILEFFAKLDAEVDKRTHQVYGDTGETIIVGGLKPDGSDGTNELSYMFLRARSELKGLDPKVLVRVYNSSPEGFLSEACQLSQMGMGYPTFCNDDVIVDALHAFGYLIEDARNYTVGGCWEPIVPGKSYDIPNAGKVVFLKCLESTINAGRSLINRSRHIGISKRRLEQYDTFEELFEALKLEIKHAVEELVVRANEHYYLEYMASPFLSTLVDDCIEKGLDVSEGGARYNNWGILGASLANCADALLVIKRVVFEKKSMSAPQLLRILESDYSGFENARLRFANKFPKFGNDDDEVDIIAKDIAEFFCEEVKNAKNRYGCHFKPALASENGYITTSKDIGASADGRKATLPYGVNFSSSLGMDRSGPTALIRSCAKIDLKKATNGAVIDIKFHPRTISGEDGLAKFVALIRAFMRLGGSQIMFNVVSREMLLDAQKNPEKYKDLIVRVWGFSAYFVKLPKEYQDHIIARVEH